MKSIAPELHANDMIGPPGAQTGAPAGDHTAAATARDAAAGPAIDRSVLGEWLGGDVAAIDDLLMVFRDSAISEHARMTDHLAAADLPALAKAAHRLRGVALSMGANGLARTAAAVDAAAQARDLNACHAAMPDVDMGMALMLAEAPRGR